MHVRAHPADRAGRPSAPCTARRGPRPGRGSAPAVGTSSRDLVARPGLVAPQQPVEPPQHKGGRDREQQARGREVGQGPAGEAEGRAPAVGVEPGMPTAPRGSARTGTRPARAGTTSAARMVIVVRIQISGRARHRRGSSTPLRSPRRGRVAWNTRGDSGVAVRLPRAVRRSRRPWFPQPPHAWRSVGRLGETPACSHRYTASPSSALAGPPVH